MLMTSWSEVCEKSSYHSPIAISDRGSVRQMTSSASRRRLAIASECPTGTARMIRAAPCARATRHAALAVEPVAIPSSTTTTVRPAIGTAGRGPEPAAAPFQLGPLPFLDSRQILRGHPGHGDHLVIKDPHAALAQRAHRELRLVRDAQLADDDDIQRGVQRMRDSGRDRHAAPGQPEDDHVLAAEVPQPLAEAPARVDAVEIPGHGRCTPIGGNGQPRW